MAGRGGGGPQGLRGCSIRPLKRAKDGDDDEWETPSPTQKPRREGLGEGLAKTGKKPAAGRCGHGRSRKRATSDDGFPVF